MSSSATADIYHKEATSRDDEYDAEHRDTMSMSTTPTSTGKRQVISRSALTYVNDVQPDLDPKKTAPGSSASTPTLPLKHTTPSAPPNPKDHKGMISTG
eukprot:12836541-Prorocentrum_lima.AAC.1